MEATKFKDDVVFAVSLEGIKLSDAQVKRIDKSIKEVVMRHVAKIDNQGDFTINKKLSDNPKFVAGGIPLGPIILGIWIETIIRWLDRIKKV